MKLRKYIFTALAAVFALAACDDRKMEWGKPDGEGDVSLSEIPLNIAEQIANYDYIKNYAAQYMPGVTIGLGMGADLYIDDADYKQVADDNFQMFTTGNAMKHASVVSGSGALNFATIDAFFDAIPAGMPVYGHTLVWHSQQRASYLNAQIAPEIIIEPDGGKIENILSNSDFEAGNTDNWGAWSSDGCTQQISEAGEGYLSDYAMKLNNPVEGANYSAQAYYTLPTMNWEVGKTYVYSAMVYSVEGNSNFQMQLQSRVSYSGGAYQADAVPAGQWYLFEKEFEMTQAIADLGITHLTIDFGAATGVTYIDDIQFGKKIEGPVNYMSNGSFENGTEGWGLNNTGAGMEVVELADAIDGSHAMKMTASASSGNAWDLQFASPDLPVLAGQKVQLSFYVKADQPGQGRVSFSGLTNGYPWMNWTGSQGSWTEAFEVGTSWQLISVVLQDFGTDFAEGATTWMCNFDFGYLPDVTYYIDNIQVTVPEEATRAAVSTRGIIEVPKTDEQKKEIITEAMQTWITGMVEHCKERVRMWDVLNEPVDEGGQLRGVDFVPAEVGDQEFYWGQYMGKEYGLKAFQFAREADPDAKLFINDYNLEINPTKLNAIVDYVKWIDEQNGTPIVDGIGTQMHLIAASITRGEIDAMFKAMAASGKLIRVTELDVRLGTATPTAAQLELQSNVYQWVAESFKENVPAAQQSGITIWSLTDHEREHEYWFPNESPNLFDANYGRKYAYKGFCDGLAGRDIGEDFSGSDWQSGN